jgi:hypothetical protein
MYWLQNVYTFIHSFFELISFRYKPTTTALTDIEKSDDFEYSDIYGKNTMNR